MGHGSEFGNPSGMVSAVTRHAFNRARAVICVSEYTRRQMHTLGIDRPVSFVINNGADAELFYPFTAIQLERVRRETGASGKFILLTVGSVTDRKGQEVVIRALPEICRAVPNAEYWMAGLPHRRKQLQELAQSLEVQDHIRFWGRVENNQLADLYHACDLFVMTSRKLGDGDFEGYGIAVMEAALCGKPAVVSRDSGLEEAVINGQTGILVPQNDAHETASAIIRLAINDSLRSSLGENARQRTSAAFTWEHVARQYLQVFTHILESNKPVP